MATAPFQLWVDIPSVASASRTSSTVTITTSADNSLVTGQWVQVEGITGAAGTSMNGVYQVTVTSATVFTYTAAGTAGSGTVDEGAVVSQDLLNPLINYASASRQAALYVDLASMAMSATGDGSSSSMGFQVMQDDTPAAGPWFGLIPDEARVRLYYKDTGTAPTDADLYFIGTIASVDAQLSGSGQGTITTVSISEVNAVLDRLVVFGSPISTKRPISAGGGFVRTGGTTVTVTTSENHGYGLAQPIKITGVLNGLATGTFNTESTTVATVPALNKFTYSSSGTNGSGDVGVTPASMSWATSGTLNQILLVFTNPHRLKAGDSITLSGFTASTAKLENLLNSRFSGTNMKLDGTGGKRIIITLAEKITDRSPEKTFTVGTVRGRAVITPLGKDQAQQNFTVAGGLSEDTAVQSALTTVNNFKGTDYAVQRLLSTNTTTKIVGAGSNSINATGITVPAGSLRSILDSLVEAYGGQDKLERRYYIDLNRRLNYVLADATAKPTYATAPYKIITTGVQDPNTTTAAATLMPYSLSVSYDHGTVKSALFNVSAEATTIQPVSKVVNYVDAGYPQRANAPVFDDVVSYPTASKSPGDSVQRAAASYFLERRLPVLTGTLTLRGAGTAAHNKYGFSSGYYQTGASTFALNARWEPGQWMDLTCAELGLSGLYRVEQVDWALEPGSFTQIITITFNRKNYNTLSAQVKRRK
jgi:hypothetical protein